MKKKLRAKRDRYKIDTYVEDGVYNQRYTVHSTAPTLKAARAEARKTERHERDLMDHGMYHIDSAISFDRKKFKAQKKKAVSNTAKRSNKNSSSSYKRGKRWGFAVGVNSDKSGQGGVMKADKAMRTCSQLARGGLKKLTTDERQAYRGMADGIYDGLRVLERRSKKR